MPPLHTIGYEKAGMDAFLAALQDAGVEELADIRAAPVSRRPGFSKKALRAQLLQAGIGYVGLPALGTPKTGRDAAKAGRFEEYRQIFHEHLATDAAQGALGELASLARTRRICLMCYERDPERCHRLIVAGRLAESHGFEVVHLFPDLDGAPQ